MYARLRTAWLQEQFSPELLPYETDAVNYHLKQIELVVRVHGVCVCCHSKAKQVFVCARRRKSSTKPRPRRPSKSFSF